MQIDENLIHIGTPQNSAQEDSFRTENDEESSSGSLSAGESEGSSAPRDRSASRAASSSVPHMRLSPTGEKTRTTPTATATTTSTPGSSAETSTPTQPRTGGHQGRQDLVRPHQIIPTGQMDPMKNLPQKVILMDLLHHMVLHLFM